LKIKYLDNLYKEQLSVKNLSSQARIDSKLRIIDIFLNSLVKCTKDYTPKAFQLIVKKLLQLSDNNLDMLEGIGKVFVRLFKEGAISEEVISVIVADFWSLKMLCPKVIVVYAISSPQYSTRAKIEEALRLDPKSLEIWKNGLRVFKEKKLMKELPRLLEKGLKELVKGDGVGLMEYYNEEINC